MKKKLLWIVVPLLFVSCSGDNIVTDIPEQNPPSQSSYHVSQEQALENLNVFLNEMEPVGTRSSGGRRQVTMVETVSAPTVLTRSSGSDVDNLFYLVHFENEEGYAVLAADNRLESVLALTDAGTLTLEDFVEAQAPATRSDNIVPGVDDADYFVPVAEGEEGKFIAGLLTDYAVIALLSRMCYCPDECLCGNCTCDGENEDRGEPGDDEAPSDSYYQYVETVGPLIRNKWRPINSEGCWAVAIAQVCGYYRFPHSFNGHIYDWNEILEYRRIVANWFFESDETEEACRVLLEDVSQATNARSGGTATDAGKGMGCLGFVNIDINRNYNEGAIVTMLRQGKPVPFRGKRNGFLGIDQGGHAWVIDGFKRVKDLNNRYPDKYYVHCNFGWSSGNHDGYYYSGSFKLGYKVLTYERDLLEGPSDQNHGYYGRDYSEAHAYINYDLP